MAPEEHLLSHIALPAAGAIEGGNESGGIESVQPWDRPRSFAGRIDAVNAALIVAGPQIQALLPILGDPLRVLDHVPVHVRDPERAIRPGLYRCWAAPVVAGSEEFGLR